MLEILEIIMMLIGNTVVQIDANCTMLGLIGVNSQGEEVPIVS